MEILIHNESGEPLACKCKLCGSFTLDVKQQLCTACNLSNFLGNFWKLNLEGGENGHVKKEDDGG